MVKKARELCEDLLSNVKDEYEKFKERGPSHDRYGGAFPTVDLATAIEATVTAAQVTVMEAATVDMAASNHLELILQP